MRRYIYIVFVILFAFVLLSPIKSRCSSRNKGVWDRETLFASPKYEIGKTIDGVTEIIYYSVDYKGKPKQVFAYYSSPGTLNGKPELDNNLPAVVCAHGGGGRAFDDWVKLWAKRGYAAISMDQRGYGAGGAKKGERLEYGFDEGPSRTTPSFVVNENIEDDWFYQAVSDVVIAHSLLLSMDCIDKSRTAITGISWGGIITTLVAGLDDRFKAAVPVYGCGYLYESGAMAPRIADISEEGKNRWINQYDPSNYVVNTKMPMLFIDGTNDYHFHLNQWQKTTDLPKTEVQRSVRLRMVHGQYEGCAPKEIYNFIDNKLNVKKHASPVFRRVKCDKNDVCISVKGDTPNAKAYLLTTNSESVDDKSKWTKKELVFDGKNIKTTLTDNCTQWLVSLEYENGANYSTRVFFR